MSDQSTYDLTLTLTELSTLEALLTLAQSEQRYRQELLVERGTPPEDPVRLLAHQWEGYLCDLQRAVERRRVVRTSRP